MVSDGIYVGAIVLSSVLLLVGTIIVTPVYRQLYLHFSLYHPTPEMLDRFGENKLKDGEGVELAKEDICAETWIYKAAATFGINFAIAAITLVVMVVYMVLLLTSRVTTRALLSTVIYVVIINSGLRIVALTDFGFDIGREFNDSNNILLFGANFFTSLSFFAALGSILSIMNGNADEFISRSFERGFGTVEETVLWGIVTIGLMITVSVVVEWLLTHIVDESNVVIET
jgi:hypothetical protein